MRGGGGDEWGLRDWVAGPRLAQPTQNPPHLSAAMLVATSALTQAELHSWRSFSLCLNWHMRPPSGIQTNCCTSGWELTHPRVFAAHFRTFFFYVPPRVVHRSSVTEKGCVAAHCFLYPVTCADKGRVCELWCTRFSDLLTPNTYPRWRM